MNTTATHSLPPSTRSPWAHRTAPSATTSTFACCAQRWRSGWPAPSARRACPVGARFPPGGHAPPTHVRQHQAGQSVLLVSSGGPISTAVGQVLGTQAQVTIALNMRIRNSAVTELSVSPKRLMLQTFNTLPHLAAPEYAHWVTHA